MRQMGARKVQPHRLGAGGQQERAIGQAAAIGQLQLALGGVDTHHLGSQAHVDVLLLIKLCRPQRQPLGGGGSGQKVLRQIRSVARQVRVAAEHRHRPGVAFTAQCFGSSLPGRTAAHDDDGFRHARVGGAGLGAGHALAGDVGLAVPLFYLPATHAAQRRRTQRLAGAQAESRVVPGAAHGVAHHQALGQRAAVVGAGGAHGKQLAAVARQQQRFAMGMAQQHGAFGNTVKRYARREILALQGGWGIAHASLLRQKRRPALRSVPLRIGRVEAGA
jgi:hypothetical protein